MIHFTINSYNKIIYKQLLNSFNCIEIREQSSVKSIYSTRIKFMQLTTSLSLNPQCIPQVHAVFRVHGPSRVRRRNRALHSEIPRQNVQQTDDGKCPSDPNHGIFASIEMASIRSLLPGNVKLNGLYLSLAGVIHMNGTVRYIGRRSNRVLKPTAWAR